MGDTRKGDHAPPARGGGRSGLRTVGAAASLLALLAPAAVGQAEGQPVPADAVRQARADTGEAAGARLVVEAGVGLLAPLANLAPTGAGSGDGGPEPAPSLAVAVSANGSAVYFFDPNLGVGVHGVWSDADVDHQRLAGRPGAGDRRQGSADFVAGSAELVYRPLGRPGGTSLDPYVAAGGGVRHLSFSDPALDDSTDPVGTAAGGVRTEVAGPVFWTTEVRGFFSTVDPTSRGSRIQTDVVVTVGIGAGF